MRNVLWAPWRMEYIIGTRTGECIFCNKEKGDSLVLYKDTSVGIMMNKYPYNTGHIMVYPCRHVGGLEALNPQEASQLFSTIKGSVIILKDVLNPDGFNIGLNLGIAAGAGIEDHIHFHIVPRWNGDTNFMPVVAEVKVMPEHLESTYSKLYPLFQGLTK